MKALDLFCGLGGWSDGLALEGFEVLGVEINPHIAQLYKYPVILQDVRTLVGFTFKGYDLIIGSPPCRDFSRMCDHGKRKEGLWMWKEPKNPQRGLELVQAFLRVVNEAQPKFWLMENVEGLSRYINLKPRCRARMSKSMIRYFWGNFPLFLIPYDANRPIAMNVQGPLRAWERARIPLLVARALGKAIHDALDGV